MDVQEPEIVLDSIRSEEQSVSVDAVAQLRVMADEIRHCVRCRLHEGRTHAAPGEGPVPADIVLLGEGPGGMEDRAGRPFVGPAGHLLDKLLGDQGLDRQALFITNCVKCRPPANRTPRQDELAVCTQTWLTPQFERLNPRLIVALGQTAVRVLLGAKAKVTRLHGTVQERVGAPCFISFHPAAALRFESIHDAIRADFEVLGEWVQAHGLKGR